MFVIVSITPWIRVVPGYIASSTSSGCVWNSGRLLPAPLEAIARLIGGRNIAEARSPVQGRKPRIRQLAVGAGQIRAACR
jgi:hypothetical protein